MNKHKMIRKGVALLSLGILASFSACKPQLMAKGHESDTFAKGQKAPAQFFRGEVWVKSLVNPDETYTTSTGSVYFSEKARSNWHSHASGQILIVTRGKGYHQIKGQPKEVIREGDVVKCPPHVDHWHGASEDSAMTHIYIVPNTEKGVVTWKAPVTDAEFTATE